MDKDRNLWYIGYCHVSCGTHGVNCKGPAVKCASPVRKKVGDKLKAGDTVAFIGNTGSASSGAHLHATLGKKLKDVFGPTSAKSDLKKAIKANQGVAPKPAAAAPAKPVTPVTEKPAAPAAEPAKPAAPAAPAARKVFYKVQSGDTLWKIANDNNTTVAELTALNGLKNANTIFVGQMIRLVK
jgi:LysM repeat protein